MNAQVLAELEDLMAQQLEQLAEQRRHSIAADTATDSVARYVARERAARCERRLVTLDRLLRHRAS